MSRPQLVVDMGSGYFVIQCLLISILSQWIQTPVVPRVSWICIPILFYPAVVPNTPRKTLWVSLLAASTEPLALGLTLIRGVHFTGGPLYLIWSFQPTYICAFIAVIPVKIIYRLGQQVKRARELGSYRLGERLGTGGMGEIFRATHQMLARPAAVKIIRPEMLGASSPNAAHAITERFRREARAAASLGSPHTINLYDFGVADDGTFFIAMELLDGIDMETLVERFGPLPTPRAIYLLRQVCDSLEEAHALGLVHRDIKPSNLFTCRMGLSVDFVKVLDFGLVKDMTAERRDATQLTADNSTLGTPAYIAPEVVRGDGTTDRRVDIYALGCVAYWLVTGQQVFQAANAFKLMLQHADTAPVPPSQRTELQIPPALDRAILACLAKNPADRPATAGVLSQQLGAVVTSERWTEEAAQAWWKSHRPESAAVVTSESDDRMLTRRVELPDL
jgi:serine/threonine protein kinase